jgi:hypothetical protein
MNIVPRHYRFPFVWRENATQHPKGGGLARAIRPHQAEDLAGRNFQIQPTDGLKQSKRFGQMGCLNG